MRRRAIIVDTRPEELGLAPAPPVDDLIERRSKLRVLVEALAGLPDEDLVVVWGRAGGLSYEEVQQLWVEWGLGEPPPPTATLRPPPKKCHPLRKTM